MSTLTHIVSYSGGIGSWGAAQRVIERYGAENTILLFADAKWEDDDTYRFIRESSAQLGARLVTIADGRTPWQVMEDQNVIGNSRIAPCTSVLKRGVMDRWIAANYTPENCRIYIGIDWTEEHRIRRLAPRKLPWIYEAPLCEPPYCGKHQLLALCRSTGVEPPAAYGNGVTHNNCRQECVKGGQAAWALKLRLDRPGYLAREEWEQGMRARVGDHSILKDRRGGTARPLTLRQLRERIEAGGQFDTLDFGGCGCALDESETPAPAPNPNPPNLAENV